MISARNADHEYALKTDFDSMLRLVVCSTETESMKEGSSKAIGSDRLSTKFTGDNTPSLEELIAQITPENRHAEVNWGPDVGREKAVWNAASSRRIPRHP